MLSESSGPHRLKSVPHLCAKLRTEGDGGHEAAGGGTFFAVGEEEVGATGGAEIDGVNVLRAETGGQELGTIGFAKVEKDAFGGRLVARRHHIEPLDGVGFVAGAKLLEVGGSVGELREKLRGDFGTDFVTATADARADGGEDVARICAEMHLHLADGFGGDASKSATPARMDGGDGALFRIDEEDRDAVGGLHGEEKARAIGDGGVATAGIEWGVVKEMDDIGMDLLERDEGKVGSAKGGLEAAAIFEDVFARVPVGEAQVEHFCVFQGRDTAEAGAEGVDE